MRPLRAPIAGSPDSSPPTTRPLRVTSHSRGDFPCQPPTTARAVAEIAQINSRAAPARHPASVPSNERCPTKTITPTGGSSGSAAVFAKASSTADSSDSSALITRRVGEPNPAAKSSCDHRRIGSSANSNQLPAAAADVSGPISDDEARTHTVSKIFCASGNGTVGRCTRRR